MEELPSFPLAFGADGNSALTLDFQENALTVLDVASRKPINILRQNDGIIYAEASPDGRHLAVANHDAIRLYDIYDYIGPEVDDVRRAVPRCLTPKQRLDARLDRAPPRWCVEMRKWPYDTEEWRRWKPSDAAFPKTQDSQ